jgi:hypothetical protein
MQMESTNGNIGNFYSVLKFYQPESGSSASHNVTQGASKKGSNLN